MAAYERDFDKLRLGNKTVSEKDLIKTIKSKIETTEDIVTDVVLHYDVEGLTEVEGDFIRCRAHSVRKGRL